MTHEEQRIWLIKQLLAEEPQYGKYQIPEDDEEQKNLLRALMNVRLPKPISEDVLKVQDEYLSEENRRAGITDIKDLTPCATDGRIYLWQGDITTLKVDAIVNAANSGMTGCFQPLHGCIDNIIGSKAGIRLRLKCNDYMCRKAAIHGRNYQEPTGQAMITPGYNLPCRYILHTVGPIVQGRLTKEHERLLASCYTSCLNLAEENRLE
ncbi:MAG: macro domain-containing protein, partial [Clostridia bacterium]|nr:macro domain-containing protein [Clostridia bacterium]